MDLQFISLSHHAAGSAWSYQLLSHFASAFLANAPWPVRPVVVFMSESQGFFDETKPNLELG